MITIFIKRPGCLPALRVVLPLDEALRIRDSLTEQLDDIVPRFLRRDASQSEIAFIQKGETLEP